MYKTEFIVGDFRIYRGTSMLGPEWGVWFTTDRNVAPLAKFYALDTAIAWCKA